MPKLALHWQIFIAIVLAVICGSLSGTTGGVGTCIAHIVDTAKNNECDCCQHCNMLFTHAQKICVNKNLSDIERQQILFV